MKKLKLPPGVREQFDLLLVDGAGVWWTFEKRFTATFVASWSRLQAGEQAALLESWGKWTKSKKPQVWVKFVQSLPAEAGPNVWSGYEPTGGIFTFVVPPCLPMPDNLFDVFVAHELRRALRVAQGVMLQELELEDYQIQLANRQAGYDEDALQRWLTEHRPPPPATT